MRREDKQQQTNKNMQRTKKEQANKQAKKGRWKGKHHQLMKAKELQVREMIKKSWARIRMRITKLS